MDLKHINTTSSSQIYEAVDMVLVWRERYVNSHIGEWQGPCTVHMIFPKQRIIFISTDTSGTVLPFKIAQVKPYVTPPHEISHSFLCYLASALQNFTPLVDPDVFMTEVLDSQDERFLAQEMKKS